MTSRTWRYATSPAGPPVSDPITLQRGPFEPAVIGRLAGGAILMIIAGAALGYPLAVHSPIQAESDLLLWFAERRTAPGDVVFRTFSGIANFWIVTGTLCIIAALWWVGTRSWRTPLLIVVTIFGALGVTGFVKLGVDRVRPDEGIVSVLSSSFPSGHAVRATAVYCLVAWVIWRATRSAAIRAATGVVVAFLLIGIGLSRVYLGVHWPTDVLVGHLLGAAWLWLVVRILRPGVALDGDGAEPVDPGSATGSARPS